MSPADTSGDMDATKKKQPPRRSKRTYTPEERAQFLQRLEAQKNKTLSQVAREIGVKPSTLSLWRQKYRVESIRDTAAAAHAEAEQAKLQSVAVYSMSDLRSYPESFRQRIVARVLGPERLTAKQVARDAGLNVTTVQRWVRYERIKNAAQQTIAAPQPAPTVAAVQPPTHSAQMRLTAVAMIAGLRPLDAAWMREVGITSALAQTWYAQVLSALSA